MTKTQTRQKDKWELEHEEEAKIKLESIESDLEFLKGLALRSANSFQHDRMYETYGLIRSSPATRKLLDFLLNPGKGYKEYGETDTRQLILQLETLMTNPGASKMNWPEVGWWSGSFIRRLEEAERHFNNETAEAYGLAYAREGKEADLDGLGTFFKIAGSYGEPGSDLQNKISIALTGDKPKEIFWKHREKLLLSLKERLKAGLSSKRFAEAGDLIKILADTNAPEELWQTAHVAITRQWNAKEDERIDAFIPPVKLITRYLTASPEEQSYLREFVHSDKLWQRSFIPHKFDGRFKDKSFYAFLTQQILRGATVDQLWNIGSLFKEFEEHPKTVGLTGIALTGTRTTKGQLLRALSKKDLEFIGSRGNNNLGGETYALPSLVGLATKDPNPKVMKYFNHALSTGMLEGDIATIASKFWDGYSSNKRKSPGTRSYFASCCYGNGFEQTRTAHLPREVKLDSKDRIERSAAALRILYDGQTGMEHQVILGKVNIEEGQECNTAAFVNMDRNVVHAVFPNSMMFDPNVTEENCNGCASLSLCRGMEEYSSVVLFDPQEYDPELLKELEKRVPGQFELHPGTRGVHKVGNFVLFPKQMTGYYNSFLTRLKTPVNVKSEYPHTIVFPYNLSGSAYLSKALRSKDIGGIGIFQAPEERVEISLQELAYERKYSAIQARLKHFTGREITTTESRHIPFIYHPSISAMDFGWKLEGNDINYLQNQGKKVTIAPVHERRII